MSDLLKAIEQVKGRRVSDDLSSAIEQVKRTRSAEPRGNFVTNIGRVGASMMNEVSAGMQGTSPVTRNVYGESTRPIVGEYAPGDGLGYVQTPNGLVNFSPSKHTALLDDASGKVMVYERTPDTDESGITSAGRVLSLGALSPVTRAVSAVPRGQSTLSRNLSDFDRAGVRPPSLGTMTEQPGTRIIEETGRNSPLTAGQFRRADERAISDTAEAVERTAAGYGGAQSPYDVGGGVRSGIDRYRARLDEVGGKLFDPVHRAIGEETPVELSATKGFLSAESERFADFPGIQDFLNSPQLKQVRTALEGTETLPYALLKDLRSKVRTRLTAGNVRDDKDEALLKSLYGSLTDDMKAAATQAGVVDKFTRANSTWRREMERVESLNKLYRKTNERIFSDIEAMTRGGTSRSSYDDIRKLFGALKGDERKEVASGLIRNMGLARAGEADSFSPARFLTAYEKMDPKSRDLLFGTANNELRRELNGLVRVMEKLRKADEVRQRPNTAIPLMGAGTLGALGVGISVSPELTALAAMTGAGASALLTSPRFIRLVRYATETGQNIPANRLALIARDAPGQADAIRQFQAALAEQQGTEQPTTP